MLEHMDQHRLRALQQHRPRDYMCTGWAALQAAKQWMALVSAFASRTFDDLDRRRPVPD